MDPTLAETLAGWRRHLHAHPEPTLREEATAAFVAGHLRDLGAEVATDVGGHGVVGTLRRGRAPASVALRADMDALPIQEASATLPWRSTVPGVMHACGHDGHTAALLGAALLLAADPGWSGTVRLVFQPAEEGGGGAARMLADGLLERFPFERIFGWHNWPGLEAGALALHDGPVMAAGMRFAITFEGVAGHAALPHLTRDPVLAAAHCVVALQSLVARTLDPLAAGVVSVTMLEAGEAQNQVPGRAVLRGTARHLTAGVGREIVAGLSRVAEGVAATFGLAATVAAVPGIRATVNHPEGCALAAAAAAGIAPVRRDLAPAMTGEDFSEYLLRVPGAFAWIGNGPGGDGRELHNPGYDFNDAILPTAAGWLAAVARRSLDTPLTTPPAMPAPPAPRGGRARGA